MYTITYGIVYITYGIVYITYDIVYILRAPGGLRSVCNNVGFRVQALYAYTYPYTYVPLLAFTALFLVK